jgi:drug/metabolite transporter (DMT)-like permease
MKKGIILALTACFIWGWIFVVPQFMGGFSSVEICLGRYFVYGILSLGIFCKNIFKGTFRFDLAIWIQALYFSLACTIVYYICVILALRNTTPSVCALILGISPITIAFYGNWKQKEINFRNLIFPSLLILAGLGIINAPHLTTAASPFEYILGLLYCLGALFAWSWYVVANARFLKNHPHITSQDWSTLVGVSTFFLVMICALLAAIIFYDHVDLPKYFTVNRELVSFVGGSLFLGVLCSWLGSYLWNCATLHLPVSLAGQLTIFETIFTLLFVYALAQKFPPQTEWLGIALLLSAVILGIRLSAKSAPDHAVSR